MIMNCTPHRIVVRTDEGDKVYEPSGMVLRVDVQIAEFGSVDGVAIALNERGPIEIDPKSTVTVIPKGVTHLLVSSMVAGNHDAVDYEMIHDVTLIAPDTGKTAIRNAENQIEAVTRFQTFC